jgi:hypothetical protein
MRQKFVTHSIAALVSDDATTMELSINVVGSAPSPVSRFQDYDATTSHRSIVALALPSFKIEMAYPSANRTYATQDKTVVSCTKRD